MTEAPSARSMQYFGAIRDAWSAKPDLPAIEDKGTWYNWRDLGVVADRLDSVLTAANLGDGARIGMVARNRMAHIAALYGLLASRRTSVMIYSALTPQALAEQIRALRLPAVLADEEDWTEETLTAAQAVGTLGLRPTADPANPIIVVTSASENTASATPMSSPDIAIEMLSSGTTGVPKRIPVRWDTLHAAIADAILNFRQSGQMGVRDGQPIPIVQPAPIANIGGLYAVITAGIEARPLALLEKFTIDGWIDAVTRNRPQLSWLAPASIQALWEADTPPEALSSLVALRTGSAALSAELQRKFEEKYDLAILITYGATEFCGVIVMWTLEDHQKFAGSKRGSTGRPRPGVQLRIADAQDVGNGPAERVGVLEVLVPRVGPDWIRTTDLASIDEDGFLFLHGRADDAINRGGFKIMPGPVMEAIMRHPAVAEAAVVGVPDARLGEVPVAAIKLREGLTLDAAELKEFLRDSLLAYQIPARMLTVDSLPRTPSLKIDRTAVKALFASA